MITMGFDTSTWVGLAMSDGVDDFRGKGIHMEGFTGWERVQLIATNVRDTIENWHPDLGVIEDYALGMIKSPDTIILLVAIGTLVRSMMADYGLPWVEVRPSTLKKWTTGKGNAKKPDMAIAVKQKWGFNSPSDDIVDAFALAQMGHYLAQLGLDKLPTGVKHGNGKF
jgi:Holliday junction resolvasome RuvABC endonuclease subunit